MIRAVSSGLVALSVFIIEKREGFASERTDRVTTVRVSSAGQPMKAQLGSDGTIHVLLDAENGPVYVRSRDGGRTFSEAISTADSSKPGLKFQAADLAVGKVGRVHVAMANNAWKLKLPEEEWGFYYASLAPDAKAFSPVRNINRKPSEGFSLAADESGDVTGCFLSGKLFAMASHDGGANFEAYREIDSNWNPCDCCTTAATYGSDGKLALLYREETDNERDMFLILADPRGGAKPWRGRISETRWKLAACPMTYYTISATSSGYVAAWPTKGEIYFTRLDRDGKVLPPGEVKTPGRSGMRAGVLALSAPDGATLIGWKNKDVFGWQVYSAKGEPAGQPGSISGAGSGAAGVALRDGRFLLLP